MEGKSREHFTPIKVSVPNGKFITYTSLKRAKHFVKDGVAVWTGEDSIEYNKKETDSITNNKFLQPKPDWCVNCGAVEDLSVHHIVPESIRIHLKPAYKRRQGAIDMMPLCVDCHHKYEKEALKLKKRFYELSGIDPVEYIKGGFLMVTLEKHSDKMPKEKRESFEKELAVLKDKYKGEIFVHGTAGDAYAYLTKRAVEYLGDELVVKIWKRHFAEHMELKYMPEWWDTESIIGM